MQPPELIPEKPDIEESTIRRDYVETPVNLAENTKLVKKFHDVAYEYFKKYRDQTKREKMEESITEADAMWRLSKRRDRTTTGEDQQRDTLSNVPSETFFTGIRTITAGQKSIIFYNPENELPAKFRPVDGKFMSEGEAQRVAEGWNLLWRFGYDQDGMQAKLKDDVLFFTNKYGRRLVGTDWAYRTEKRIRRLPGYYLKDGTGVEYNPQDPPRVGSTWNKDGELIEGLPEHAEFGPEFRSIIDPDTGFPMSYAFVEREEICENWPTLQTWELKNCWFDMEIAESSRWPALICRAQKGYDWAVQGQRDGMFLNVEKVKTEHLYAGEDDLNDSNLATEKATNADENYESEPTGELDVVEVWMKAPIDADSNRPRGKSQKTKGVWSKNAMPVWYQAIFVGKFGQMTEDMDKSPCVCLMLRKNPYNHGRLPRWMVYSHKDDNGALTLSYSTIMAHFYELDVAILNKYMDNVELLVNKPWKAVKGRVLNRNGLKFTHGNQVIWMAGSTDGLEQIDVDDVTGTTIPVMNHVERRKDMAMGTDKPMRGEYAGSRTTGTEVLENKEEAQKPAIEDARFISSQIFPRLLADFKDLYEQFGDPSQPIPVKIGEVTRIVVPGELYGDLRVVVDSVDRFEQDLSTKQALVNFVNTRGFESAIQLMGDAQTLFWQDLMKSLGVKKTDCYFPDARYVEAENQALADCARIINDPATAVSSLPQPEERHKIHLKILRDKKMLYLTTVPKEQQNPETVRMFDMFIEMHEQMDAQGAAPAGGAGAMMNQPSAPTNMAGEAAGDAMGGPGQQVTPA